MCVNELCYSVSLLENSEIVEREREMREKVKYRGKCVEVEEEEMSVRRE
jgi:hypothetical protein